MRLRKKRQQQRSASLLTAASYDADKCAEFNRDVTDRSDGEEEKCLAPTPTSFQTPATCDLNKLLSKDGDSTAKAKANDPSTESTELSETVGSSTTRDESPQSAHLRCRLHRPSSMRSWTSQTSVLECEISRESIVLDTTEVPVVQAVLRSQDADMLAVKWSSPQPLSLQRSTTMPLFQAVHSGKKAREGNDKFATVNNEEDYTEEQEDLFEIQPVFITPHRRHTRAAPLTSKNNLNAVRARTSQGFPRDDDDATEMSFEFSAVDWQPRAEQAGRQTRLRDSLRMISVPNNVEIAPKKRYHDSNEANTDHLQHKVPIFNNSVPPPSTKLEYEEVGLENDLKKDNPFLSWSFDECGPTFSKSDVGASSVAESSILDASFSSQPLPERRTLNSSRTRRASMGAFIFDDFVTKLSESDVGASSGAESPILNASFSSQPLSGRRVLSSSRTRRASMGSFEISSTFSSVDWSPVNTTFDGVRNDPNHTRKSAKPKSQTRIKEYLSNDKEKEASQGDRSVSNRSAGVSFHSCDKSSHYVTQRHSNAKADTVPTTPPDMKRAVTQVDVPRSKGGGNTNKHCRVNVESFVSKPPDLKRAVSQAAAPSTRRGSRPCESNTSSHREAQRHSFAQPPALKRAATQAGAPLTRPGQRRSENNTTGSSDQAVTRAFAKPPDLKRAVTPSTRQDPRRSGNSTNSPQVATQRHANTDTFLTKPPELKRAATQAGDSSTRREPRRGTSNAIRRHAMQHRANADSFLTEPIDLKRVSSQAGGPRFRQELRQSGSDDTVSFVTKPPDLKRAVTQTTIPSTLRASRRYESNTIGGLDQGTRRRANAGSFLMKPPELKRAVTQAGAQDTRRHFSRTGGGKATLATATSTRCTSRSSGNKQITFETENKPRGRIVSVDESNGWLDSKAHASYEKRAASRVSPEQGLINSASSNEVPYNTAIPSMRRAAHSPTVTEGSLNKPESAEKLLNLSPEQLTQLKRLGLKIVPTMN